MKAMIFAAGLGTRLQPITNTIPKALVEVKGVPLIEIVIKKLMKDGYDEFVVNVHHFADQLIDFLNKNNNFGASVHISDETGLLLETGGGLKKAEGFLQGNEPFLVHNVDILSDIALDELFDSHVKSKALTTLVVRKRESSRYLLFDSSQQLCEWKNNKTGEKKIGRKSEDTLSEYAFSGIQMMSPAIFNLITESGRFSIIDTYLRLAEKQNIKSYIHDTGYWMDLGTIKQLEKANSMELE